MPDEHTHKRCRRCDVEKPASEFSTDTGNRDGLTSYCNACNVQVARDWYAANRDYALAYQRRKRRENRDLYRDRDRERWLRSPAVQITLAARETPCVDCGVQLPAEVMELDHVRGVKSFSLGGRVRSYDPALVEAEVAKCDVRCPNCHRMRHYRERKQIREERAVCVEAMKCEQMTFETPA